MKKYLLLSAFAIINFVNFAQDLPEFEGEIKWSELFSVNRKVSAPEIIGHDGQNVYLMRYIKRKRFLEKYNIKTLQLQKSVEIILEYKNKDLELSSYFMFGNTPLLNTTFYNRDTKTTHSFFQVVNTNSLLISEPRPVGKNEVPEVKGVRNKIAMAQVGYETFSSSVLISDDRALAFISEPIYGEVDKDTKMPTVKGFRGKIYDDKLNLVAENDYNLPYDRFSVVQTKFSNSGLLYVAGYQTSIEEQGLLKRDQVILGKLEILVLDLERGEIEILNVDVTNRKIREFSFLIDDKDAVIISGLISKKGGGVSGGFYTKYDANFKEVSSNVVDFEDDFVTQDWSDRQKKKLEKSNSKKRKKGEKESQPDFYKYQLRDLILKPNGSLTLLAEQYYVRVVTTTYTDSQGNMRTKTTYYYYYNDVIVMNFSPSGKLEWKTLIDKYQVSVNDGGYYSSFFTVLENNDINVIFNDRESNSVDKEGLTKQELKALKRSTVGVRVLVDEEGNQSREKLFEFEENGLKLVPKICDQADEESVFLYARSRHGDKLGAINW
ncbi:hypothetical protein N8987_00255 [Crocinitomix sp.]|nr:hypothetical protein [Crocinitomix sp.]